MEGFLADVYLGIGELAVDSAEYYARPSYSESSKVDQMTKKP